MAARPSTSDANAAAAPPRKRKQREERRYSEADVRDALQLMLATSNVTGERMTAYAAAKQKWAVSTERSLKFEKSKWSSMEKAVRASSPSAARASSAALRARLVPIRSGPRQRASRRARLVPAQACGGEDDGARG